jgi:two-component system CheB/CheR fusion protein
MQKKIRVTPKKEKITPAVPKTASFPIVGIGASAGGLEAYQELLKNLSAKPGMAFVFIMHLAPGHKSMLTELLARLTKMPVREIKNGMPIEVNHVYIITPGTNVSIASGKLKLNNMEDAGFKRMPIDWFFRSLAEEQGNRAIGIILSGTATDGTLGAEAIKAEGGIIFAQDEKSAKYDGMPQSAIAAGCVDFVLSPKKIASELERIAKHPLISFAGPVKTDKSIITEDKGLKSIFDILRSAKGLDFTHYKTPTISRRVSRRMVLLKLKNRKGYIKFLRENKDEVEKLYEDLLINVTSFFRDPKVFDALKKQVLPAILKNRTKGQDVRIWIPGCSSGEEAYSIAICLFESLGNKTGAVPVQIFSTDVRETSINEARRGIYGKNIKNSITPERLKRFFTKIGDSYKISKQLREMCIFSRQNVFSDPPFSNLDLISCRNLLIYLQPVLQKKVFHNFHYALKPGGFLLLGNSEAAGGYSNLFKSLDGKHRIFVKKYLSVGPELESGQKYYPSKKLEIKEKTDIKKGKETDIESIVERIVLSEYAPCGVLIDSDMGVVQFRGHTGRYLESAAGKPSLDIFKLAREGLFLPLRAAIYKARETKHKVKREADAVLYNGRRMRVNITVVPVESGPLKEEFFLVLFDEIIRAVGSKNMPKARGGISLKRKSVKSDEYIGNLQKELAETKEYLQTVTEEQESANEEVKTANEEILSSNEELQSTNEELETAKEELQSSNEELVTTNEELQNRNKEVVLLNDDLINLLGSINMPVVMMGTDLVIRRITPQAEKALNVISSDIGRPISKIKLNVDIPDLEKILLDVIESLHPKTFEIKDREGNWYSAYIRPYRTLDNKIDGVVAIFVDITERKKAQQVIEEAREYAESIVETMREPLIVLDTDLKVISANRSFYQTFKVNHKETQGQFIYDLGNRQWNIPKLRLLLEEILPKSNTFDNYEIEHDFETIGPKTMLFNARRLAAMQMTLITIEDITERKQMERELAQAKEDEFRAVFDNAVDGILIADTENKKFYVGNNSICRMLGYSPEEIKNLGVMDIHPEKDIPYVADQFERQLKREFSLAMDLPIKRKDGSVFYADVNATTLKIAGKIYLMGFFHDTTERKNKEKLVLDANRRLEKVSGELSAAKRDLEQKNEALQKAGSELEQHVKERTAELAGANKVLAVTQQNMHTVIKHSADGLLIVDDNKIVRFMNPSAGAILGRGAQDLLGEPFGLPLTTDKPSEVQLVAADGSVTIAEVQAVRTEWENEPVYLATIRDITLRKKAQQEMEAANEQLRKFNDLKDEFVSMASHELRTPLSIIIGAVKLVLDQIPGKIVPEQKEVLEMAMNNLGRLTRIVDAQLNISKIESGKIELHKTNIDIRGLIEETIVEYRDQAEKKGIRLGFRVPEQPVDLCIDGDKIKEVLMNLISNGLKFTPAGGSIEMECKAEQKEVQLSVSDTGCGIAEQDMPRLFEKFAQFGRKVGPGEKGTGLGLAICKGIVELHKGRIWAKSQQGKGTVLTFALPWLGSHEVVSELLEQVVRQAVKNNANAGVIVMSAKAKGQEDEEQMQRVLKEVQVLVEQNLRRNADNTVIQNTKEVLVVLGSCDIAGAAAVCQRLTQAIECHLVDKDLSSKLDLLIGYAAYPDDGQTGQSLIEKAREAGVACSPSNKA